MLIFAVDDEPKSLSRLHRILAEAAPGAEIMDFPLGTEALRAITSQGLCPDAVFTDIEMPELDGLALAVKLKQASPASKIVFVTAYSEYAVEAIRQRISGYVLKPVQKSRIPEELVYIAPDMKRDAEKLTVRCFGQFDVFWKGKPLMFGRKQTRELFAFLISSNGAVCTAEEVAAALWEEETDMRIAKRRIRQLVSDLKTTLAGIGMEDALVRRSGQLAILRDKVDCDYFRMLDGDMNALKDCLGMMDSGRRGAKGSGWTKRMRFDIIHYIGFYPDSGSRTCSRYHGEETFNENALQDKAFPVLFHPVPDAADDGSFLRHGFLRGIGTAPQRFRRSQPRVIH